MERRNAISQTPSIQRSTDRQTTRKIRQDGNEISQEEVYSEAIDFTGIDKERERIWDEIKRYI